jgi:hypothetical protein
LGLSLKETTPAKSTVVSFSSLDLFQGLPSVEDKLKIEVNRFLLLFRLNLSFKVSVKKVKDMV